MQLQALPQINSDPFSHFTPNFANQSERDVAKQFDACGLRWEYETTTFPFETDNAGIKRGFTPDFYLPDINAYFEVSAGKSPQRRNQKNAKMRRMHQAYPHVAVFLGTVRRDILSVAHGYTGEYGTSGTKRFEAPLYGNPEPLKEYLLARASEKSLAA